MNELRKSAKGRSCQVRIPGICNGDSETTVLAHLNGGGMGIKQPDLFGAFCCFSCHNCLDRRTPCDYTKNELELFHFQGMVRTQRIWLREGLIVVKGGLS